MRFLSRMVCLLIGMTAFGMLPSSAYSADYNTIAIIVGVNQDVEQLKLSANQLNLIFWRKQLYWPHGKRIKPANLNPSHPLRLHFSQSILGSQPKEQVDYWNGLYFNGVSPPYVVNSEEAMLRYVAQTNDAIGYVSACKVDERVKTLFWLVGETITANKPSILNCNN